MGGKSPSGGGTKQGLVGRGQYDPVTDTWEWYEYPPGVKPESSSGRRISWPELLEQWPLIEADLHDVYGVDVEADPSPLDTRTWRWLRIRIAGLLNADTRLGRHFTPPDTQQRR